MQLISLLWMLRADKCCHMDTISPYTRVTKMDEPKIQTVNTYSIIYLELILIYNGAQVNSKEKI